MLYCCRPFWMRFVDSVVIKLYSLFCNWWCCIPQNMRTNLCCGWECTLPSAVVLLLGFFKVHNNRIFHKHWFFTAYVNARFAVLKEVDLDMEQTRSNWLFLRLRPATCKNFIIIIIIHTFLYCRKVVTSETFIIIIIHEFHRDPNLEQNFRAAMCHVLHYSCNVSATVTDSLHCGMICRTVLSTVVHFRPYPFDFWVFCWRTSNMLLPFDSALKIGWRIIH